MAIEKHRRDTPRRQSGAVTVEYIVLVFIFLGVALMCLGLGAVLARNAQRADMVLRSNTP